MLYTPKNCKNKILVDCKGTPIPYAVTFDDETFEAEILIAGRMDNGHTRIVTIPVTPKKGELLAWETVKVKVKLPGAKMIERPKRNVDNTDNRESLDDV